MKTRVILPLILLCGVVPASAANVTVSEQYKIRGYYNYDNSPKGKSAQGMCIYKNTALLFNDSGYCRVYSLKSHKVVGEFLLDTHSPENHANSANVGVEFPENNRRFPAIYVSECYGKRRCFVESVTSKGANLIQTIRLAVGDKTEWPHARITDKDTGTDFARTGNWYVDKENKFLYASGRADETKQPGGLKTYFIVKLPLPKLSDGDITFTQKDILEKFTVSFRELFQGGVIRNGKLYLPVGHATPKQRPGEKKRKDPMDRALIIVDLSAQKIEAVHPLSDQLSVEPEDADFHNGKLLIWCGQKGGLWQVKGL